MRLLPQADAPKFKEMGEGLPLIFLPSEALHPAWQNISLPLSTWAGRAQALAQVHSLPRPTGLLSHADCWIWVGAFVFLKELSP